MRPFHLGGRVWVDLDAVQEMSYYTGWAGLTIRWHCAFRDKPREEAFIEDDDANHDQAWYDAKNAELVAKHFDPFFAAWTANAKA